MAYPAEARATTYAARQSIRTCLLVTALWTLGAFKILIAPLAAQTIAGILVEAETGAPVEGASVTLLNRDGERLAWRLTNAAGRFDFRVPGAGSYRLQADRIGYARVLSEAIPIARGETVAHRLEAPVEAITLAGIEVASTTRCEVRPGQGASTATVWEEVRKALEATSRTSDLGLYRYEIRRFERELDARGSRVRNEESRIQRQVMARPFGTLPVDDLLENGFVRPEDEGSVFYAPDADVLLSDAFLDTHCMSLTEGDAEAEGLLGLTFEPTEDRGVPDISGVLWLDVGDAELQWLDYRYEFLDVPNPERLGGRVRFYGLPDGTWIVRDWHIRMPILGARFGGGRVRPRLIGIREEGGVVLRVNNLQGALLLDSSAGIIDGVILDSEGSLPAGEVVVLLDDSTRITTDEEGRFRFTGLAGGYYSLRVVNPVLDSLGFSPEATLFEVSPGEVASARLGFPSLDAVMTGECSPADLSKYGGILAGFALLETGESAPGVQVSIRWQEAIEGLGDAAVVDYSITMTELRRDGFFLICGVPRDRWVEIRAVWDGGESVSERFDLSQTERVSRRDITVPVGR